MGSLKYAFIRAKVYKFSTLGLMLFALGGCSSSIFSGSDNKSELDKVKGDGKYNSACLNLNLGSATLDVAATRNLVNCLNSNGSIHEYANLINSLSDAQIGALMDVVNAELLGNTPRLKAMDVSFKHMDEQGIVDRAMSKVGKLLDNPKFARSAIRLLKQGTAVRNPDGSFGKVNPAVLTSVRLLAEELGNPIEARTALADSLEMAVRLSSTHSYNEAVDGLKSVIAPGLPGVNLKYFTGLIHEYTKAKIKSHDPLGKVVLWGIEDGSLLSALDKFLYNSCDHAAGKQCSPNDVLSVDDQIHGMSSLLTILNIDHKEDVLRPMMTLFQALDAPISCMAGTKQVPNAGMFVMSEFTNQAPIDVPYWITRDNILKVKVANGLCDFPRGPNGEGFNEVINVCRKLADHENRRSLVTMTHLLKAFEVGETNAMSAGAAADIGPLMHYPQNQRYRRFLVHWMGDKDPIVNLYSHLADVMGELTRAERAVTGNLFYLLTTTPPGSKDRERLRSAVRAVMRLHEPLATTVNVPGTAPAKWRSVYDVVSEALLKTETDTVYDLLFSVSDFIDMPERFTQPLLEVARDALLVNDASPVLDVILAVAQHAEEKEVFFNTLFEVVDSKQFDAAMRLTAKMASDGSLKRLMRDMLTMFKESTKRVPGEPALAKIPAVLPVDSQRDHCVSGQTPWVPASVSWASDLDKVQACKAVNVDLPFSKTTGSGWNTQLGQMAACINSNDQSPEAESLIYYLMGQPVQSGKNLFQLLIDIAASVIPSIHGSGATAEYWKYVRAIYDEFGDLLTNENNFRDSQKANGMLRFLFKEKYCPTYPGSCVEEEKLSLTQTLFRLVGTASNKSQDLQTVLEATKATMIDAHIGKAVPLVYHVFDEGAKDLEPVRADKKPSLAYVEGRVREAFKKFTKTEPSQAQIADVIDDYFRQPWQARRLTYRDAQGKTRKGFKDVNELKGALKPFLDELAKGDRAKWLMYYFQYFNGSPYTAEWWADWFKRLSTNVRPIPYYYPGMDATKEKPVIRLVSQLDLLDLIVVDADFALSDPEVDQPAFPVTVIMGKPESYMHENVAIRYLTLIGTSGRDMKTHAIDPMERELEIFYGLSQGPLGGTMSKELTRRLFNLYHIFPILREMDREHMSVLPDGRSVLTNDLGVLRDLFKSLLSEIPVGMRDPNRNPLLFRKSYNPLAVVTNMTNFGILRQITHNVWFQNPQTGALEANRIDHILKFLIDTVSIWKDGKFYINSQVADMLEHLLQKDCDHSKAQNQHLPCLVAKDFDKRSFDERFVAIGKLLSQGWEWTKNDNVLEDQGQIQVMTRIKRGAYRMFDVLDGLNTRIDGSSREIEVPMARVLNVFLGTPEGSKLLGDHLDLLESLVVKDKGVHQIELLAQTRFSNRSRGDNEYSYREREAFQDLGDVTARFATDLANNNSKAARALLQVLEPIVADPSLNQLRAISDWMDEDEDYQLFKNETMDPIMTNLMAWFAKDGQTNVREHALRQRLQVVMGERASSGDLRDIIVFLGSQSQGSRRDALYGRVKFLGEEQNIQRLNSFLELLRSGIQDVYQLPESR